MTWFRIAALASALIYPILLLCGAAALHFVGERWWVTTVALYLPRIALAAPLPVVVLGLLACGRSRWLWTQSVSAFVILFPLMGLVVPVPRLAGGKAPSVRVLSYNINSALGGVSNVVAEIDRFAPDVVLLQEVAQGDELKRALRSRYPTVDVTGQFLAATRFAIVSTFGPERLPFDGRERSPRFLEYVLDTPIDRIAIYSVHPISPREDFYVLRGRGLRREILSGHLFSGDAGPSILANARLRALQAEAIAGAAARNLEPVVIAGDTNLPDLSPVFSRYLSRFQDGFVKAGAGFGYTYPNDRHPWMRIDRILATDALRFVKFEVGSSAASDHLCVVADLQRAR